MLQSENREGEAGRAQGPWGYHGLRVTELGRR